MDKILEMKQERAQIIAKMRSLNSANMTQEQIAEFEQCEKRAKELADNILRAEKVRGMEGDNRFAPSVIVNAEGEKLQPGIRLARLVKVRILAAKQEKSAAEIAERIYPNDMVLRSALTEGVEADGGAMVPENLFNEIIPLLRQYGVTRALGATIMPLPNGNLNLVRQTGAANYHWVGEAGKIGNSKPGLGLLPLSAKKLAGIVPVSNELLEDSSLAADTMVLNELVEGIAESEDITALYGSGNTNEPKGIVTACAATKVTVGGEITQATIVNMVGKLLSAKLTNPNFAWRIPGVLWAPLYNLTDASGRFVFRDGMDAGNLCGYPFTIDNNIRVGNDTHKMTSIFFGDWKQFIIGEAGQPRISLSADASFEDGDTVVSAFENDLTLIRVTAREDFGVRYPEAFVYAENIHTA